MEVEAPEVPIVSARRSRRTKGQCAKECHKESCKNQCECILPAAKQPTSNPSPVSHHCCINWSLRNNAAKLSKIVATWDGRGKETKKRNGMVMSMPKFTRNNSISHDIMYKYAHRDNSKWRKIGESVGKNSVLSKENSDFLCSVAIYADRANQGMTCDQIIGSIMELEPALAFMQAKNLYQRTFKKGMWANSRQGS